MKKENKEITITELNEIQKEIRENKEKSLIKKMDKFKLILTNILIAIAIIIYLWIIVGIANINEQPKENDNNRNNSSNYIF